MVDVGQLVYTFALHEWGATRPCAFAIATGDVAFLDFDRVDDRLKIVRASFDGFGCFRCGNKMALMNADDSSSLLRMVEAKVLDQEECRKIVVSYCVENKGVIWEAALGQHGLQFLGYMPLQVDARQGDDGVAVTFSNLSGEVLGRLDGLEPTVQLNSLASLAQEHVTEVPGYLWRLVLPSGVCLADLEAEKILGDVLEL